MRSAVVQQVDHRAGECLERVVHLTNPFEAQQQASKGILPGEHAFNGSKAFLEDGFVKLAFARTVGVPAIADIFRDIGPHAAVEDGLRFSRQS